MKIPEPVRLWWYDGPGVRVIRYSARQWGVYVIVCIIVLAATFVPTQNSLALALHAVVPVLAVPAGLFAAICFVIACERTRRFRAGRR
jgi:hypothetical protein